MKSLTVVIRKIIIAVAVGMIAGMSVEAHETTDSIRNTSRPVTSTYSIETGKQWSRATYLSPYYYKGIDLAIAGNWTKRMPFSPNHAGMTFDTRIALWPRLLNPGGNASMQGFDINFFWGMQALWELPYSLTAGVGGGPEFDGGVLMLLRNSNNPVAVNLSADLSLAATLEWKGRIGKLPIMALWNLRMPLAGAFFMPGYGETYYEIYLGNHSGLAHAGWPGNHLRINSKLAVRLDFGRTAMEIGYRMITDRMSANNLVTRQLTHAFTIGVIPHGLGLRKPSKPSRDI